MLLVYFDHCKAAGSKNGDLGRFKTFNTFFTFNKLFPHRKSLYFLLFYVIKDFNKKTPDPG